LQDACFKDVENIKKLTF